MTEDVDDGDIDDRLELAEEHVGDHGPKDGCEVTEHGEGVVDDLKRINMFNRAYRGETKGVIPQLNVPPPP